MAQPLTPRRPGRAVTKFSKRALLVGGGALTALVLGGVLLPMTWQGTPPAPAKEQPPAQQLKLPDVITRPLTPRPLTIAAPIVQEIVPVPPSQPDTAPDTGKGKIASSFMDTLNPFATQPSPATKEPHGTPQSQPAPPATKAPTAPKEAKPRKGWAMLAAPQQREAQASSAALDEIPSARQVASQGQPGGTGAQGLIQSARWAIPAEPLKTIYRSQTLTGRLLQAVHSEKPGQVKIQLTVPVLDKFGYDTTILPKDTLVIATQGSRTQYGDSRLGLKIEQLELPSGEVIDVRATVGDDAGSHGMKGKVNNHYGKLILGVGLNALLNIGIKSAVGTPGPQQFFRNPVEDAAQDIGQAVQGAAASVIGRELQVSPTITIPVGTFCTINLLENMTFSRPPVVAR